MIRLPAGTWTPITWLQSAYFNVVYESQVDHAPRYPIAAADAARELLLSFLSVQQQADYNRGGYFYVISSAGRRWRIRNAGPSGNVDLMAGLEETSVKATYCFHPSCAWPHEQAYLAQMLALVTDEDSVLDVANRCYW